MAKSRSFSSTAGFSLPEVMVASAILATSMMTLASLVANSTRSNLSSRNTTYATVLAEQKLEELRALTWGFDTAGLPLSDRLTNTAVEDPNTPGGTGLDPSPPSALQENTRGYVDFTDRDGHKIGDGGTTPPDGTVYTRRWSITPLPTNPNNTLIIQVLVTRLDNRGTADQGAVKRLPDEARMITVKTRKAQ